MLSNLRNLENQLISRQNAPWNETFLFKPVIIIGAPRSGTNALRASLTQVSEFESWPCDEINGIWKHGNLNYSFDDLPVSGADNRVISFIRKKFYNRWLATGKPKFLVEKTTANSLRLPFVKKVIPEAKFLILIREGDSVVKSAQKRWKGEFEYNLLEYWSKKLPYIPIQDLPHYILQIVKERVGVYLSKNKQIGMGSWGPRHQAYSDLRHLTLLEKCVLQWALCILETSKALRNIDKDDYLVINYCQLTADPYNVYQSVLSLLNRLDLLDQSSEFSKNIVERNNTDFELEPLSPSVRVVAEEAMKTYEHLSGRSS